MELNYLFQCYKVLIMAIGCGLGGQIIPASQNMFTTILNHDGGVSYIGTAKTQEKQMARSRSERNHEPLLNLLSDQLSLRKKDFSMRAE